MFDKDIMAIAFELDGISYRARYHERSGEKWFSFAPVKVARETVIAQRNLYRAELDKLLAFLCGITDNDQTPADIAQRIQRRIRRTKTIIESGGAQ